MDYLRRTWAEIDLDAIRHNFGQMKDRLKPDCLTMAIVKADAYGHGDGFVARTLQEQGVDWFGVSNLNEAISLRRQKITKPILILGFTPPEHASYLAKYQISQTVFSLEYAKLLSDCAVAQGVEVDCHIKVDTGMTRIGFYAQHLHEQQAAQEIAQATSLAGLRCTGIFTHFSCADEYSSDSAAYTFRQYDSFCKTIGLLEERDIFFSLQHCCNSAATLSYPQMHMDMVRLGVVLYGLEPSAECVGMADLHPAMSLYTTVSMVKELQAGVSVSYGRRYTTLEDGHRIASIAVGYADGYRRNFTNKGHVILHGRYAPITGAVCMDQLMVDVTDIPDVKSGDVVTLLGKQGQAKITLADFAKIDGTIPYEECCLIGRRVPRVYLEHGEEIAVVDYIISTLST